MSEIRDEIDDIGRQKDDAAVRRTEIGVMLVLGTVQFTSIVDFMLVMPLGPQLMQTLKIDTTRFGLIVSAYTIAAGVAGFIAAPIIDRFGRKAAFLTLYFGFLVGTLFCGLADTYELLLAARVLTGCFGGILGGMAMTIIGDVFPPHRHATATGVLMMAFSVASVLGVPFGLAIGLKYGWQAPFFALAALGLPVFAAGFWTLPTLRGHLQHKTSDVHPLVNLWETATTANHLPAFALIIALMLGSFAVVPYISTYLVLNAGLPNEQLPWVYVSGGVFSLISSPIIGRLADRFGRRLLYFIVAPFSALMMFVVTILPPVPLVVSMLVVGFLMVGNSGRMVAAMALIIASVEPRRRGSFMSVYSSVQHISGGIGTYIGALVLGKTVAGEPLVGYQWDGLIAGGFTLFSVYLVTRLRPYAAVPKITPGFSLAAAEAANADQVDPMTTLEVS